MTRAAIMVLALMLLVPPIQEAGRGIEGTALLRGGVVNVVRLH